MWPADVAVTDVAVTDVAVTDVAGRCGPPYVAQSDHQIAPHRASLSHSKGGKGSLFMPKAMEMYGGPLKKVKKQARGNSKKQKAKKAAAAEKGENWSERKALHVAKMSKKIEATKKAKKSWQ